MQLFAIISIITSVAGVAVGIYGVILGVSRFRQTANRRQLALVLAGLTTIAFVILDDLTRFYFQGQNISTLFSWAKTAVDIAVPVLWIYCLLKLTRKH